MASPSEAPAFAKRLKQLPRQPPAFVAPMKCQLREELPRNSGWIFELKLDGIRAIAVRDGGDVQLFSRTHHELTHDFRSVVDELLKLPSRKFVLDGEIVALDSQGRSSFQLLQNRRASGAGQPAFYYAFDILNCDGHDLKSLTLKERKDLLEELTRNASDPIRFSTSIEADPDALWAEVQRLGVEGIVAKRSDSSYEPDRRGGNWLKIKAQNEQEFVIGGYTPPKGSRKYFGALLVGYYEGNKLKFASKVGTGFNENTLRTIYQKLNDLQSNHCPFTDINRLPSELRRCTWVKPKLVCQVKFLEWTHDNNLRAPVFLALRDDKPAKDVLREAA